MFTESIEKIRAWLAEPRNRANHLAKEAGVHANRLVDVYREDWDPRVSTLAKLDAAVDRLTCSRDEAA